VPEEGDGCRAAVAGPGEDGGVDLLVSGPDAPGGGPVERATGAVREAGRRLLGARQAAGSRSRRRLAAAVGVMAAIGAAVALRTAAEQVPPRPAAAPPARVTAAPGGLAASLPGPPYDRLPGRTPIPEPTRAAGGDLLRGGLPAVGRAGSPAATAAAELVLGRYCRRPWRYAVGLDRVDGWQRVRALALRLDRSTDPPWVVLDLRWTGRAYVWTGQTVQLSNC
jgi:hypothetical protein